MRRPGISIAVVTVVSLLAAAFLSMVAPRTAADGGEVVDQDSYPACFPPDGSISILTRNIRYYGPYGQSFTPTKDNLAGLDLLISDMDLSDSPETTLFFDIYLDDFSGVLVGSTNVTFPNGFKNDPRGLNYHHIDFAPPLPLTPGALYALDVHPSPSESNESWGVGSTDAPGWDPYPNGTLIVYGQPYWTGDLCFRTYALENQPPAVVVSQPGEGALLSHTATVAGTAADPDGTVQLVELRADAGPWWTAIGTSSWTYALDTTDLTDGVHFLYARAFDGMKYSNEAHVRVVVDNGPPDVVITSPAMGASLPPEDVLVTWNASDAISGIARQEFILDGGAPILVGAGDASYVLHALDRGPHEVTITAYDCAGSSASAYVSFIVETKPSSASTGFWWLLVGAAVAVLLFLLFAFVILRRRRSMDQEENA